MPRLAKPSLPDGPLKELNDALHELHARAHRPSCTTIAKALKEADPDRPLSKSTVQRVFSNPTVPVTENLMRVVEYLAGKARNVEVEATLDRFDALVQAAAEAERSPAAETTLAAEEERGEQTPPSAELITGPHSELATMLVEAYAREYGAEGLEDWIAPDDPEVAVALSELVVDAMADAADVDGLEAKTRENDAYAGQRLAELYAERGDLESLQELAADDESVAQPHASYQLRYWVWSDHPHWSEEPVEPLDERIRRRQERSHRSEAGTSTM
ncbi:hypothetical protein [Amycolatopsis sp. NPDC098790]|uniref:hypothetical protein n=1 Tax=Amycolatopsis sp. NPDC098790 TaxID=3363939 RepID=UPI00380F2C1A